MEDRGQKKCRIHRSSLEVRQSLFPSEVGEVSELGKRYGKDSHWQAKNDTEENRQQSYTFDNSVFRQFSLFFAYNSGLPL